VQCVAAYYRACLVGPDSTKLRLVENKNAKLSGEFLRKKYDFRWEVLDIIVNGKSSIDVAQGFNITSLEEADRFIRSYGFDLENSIEQAEVFGHFHETLNFIRKYFLQPENPDGLRLEIPRRIMELTDIRELLLMACFSAPNQSYDSQGTLLRNWACSILKVMHTIAHIDQDLRAAYFVDIQKQIFDRFYKVVHRDSEGKLYLGEREDDPFRVDLMAFETKPKKSRDSLLIKLLHKPENVAEDIFDRVGMRFVTYTRLDALRVVKYLRDKMIVMPPNIKPSRSRNTLVDLDDFRAQLADITPRIDRGEVEETELLQRLDMAAHAPSVNPENPHSSEFYRAIQFTCRQLIKLRNPLYDDLKVFKTLARSKAVDEEAVKIAERIDLKYIQKEVHFFYPYEVQIVDRQSFDENEKGRSAHSEYKRAQLHTALKRVMGTLVDAVR
jgi:uncharacterized protein (TIGR04562 family)